MVAPLTTTQRIVCTAVRIDEPGVSRSNRLAYRPSELVPWADPYIAGLVRRLQSEVRFERATIEGDAVAVARTQSAHARLAGGVMADLEPPSPSIDSDWDAWDQPRWSIDGDTEE